MNQEKMESAYKLINERMVDYLHKKIENEGFNVSTLVIPTSFIDFNQIKESENEVLYRLREIMKIVCEEMDLDSQESYSVASGALIDIKVFVMEGNSAVKEMQQEYINWHKSQNK